MNSAKREGPASVSTADGPPADAGHETEKTRPMTPQVVTLRAPSDPRETRPAGGFPGSDRVRRDPRQSPTQPEHGPEAPRGPADVTGVQHKGPSAGFRDDPADPSTRNKPRALTLPCRAVHGAPCDNCPARGATSWLVAREGELYSVLLCLWCGLSFQGMSDPLSVLIDRAPLVRALRADQRALQERQAASPKRADRAGWRDSRRFSAGGGGSVATPLSARPSAPRRAS